MFKNIFPKVNEATIFVITVTLYSSILYIPEVTIKTIGFFALIWSDWREALENTSGFLSVTWFLIKSLFMTLFATIFGVAIFFGPLLLPFTEKDIRGLCLTIILVDLALLITFNIVSTEFHPLLRLFFVVYYSAWFVYVIVSVRLRNNVDHLVCSIKCDPQLAIKLAFSSSLSTFVLYFFIDWWWVDAYLTSIHLVLVANWVWNNKYFRRAINI